MRKSITRVVTATVAAAGLTLATLAPASAGVDKVRDPNGPSGAFNIKSATLKHSAKRVVVSTKVGDLKRGKGQILNFQLDGEPKGKYVVVVELRKKPLLELQNASGKPVRCKADKLDVNFKRDRTKVSIPRSCVKKPRTVKARVLFGRTRILDSTKWMGPVRRG